MSDTRQSGLFNVPRPPLRQVTPYSILSAYYTDRMSGKNYFMLWPPHHRKRSQVNPRPIRKATEDGIENDGEDDVPDSASWKAQAYISGVSYHAIPKMQFLLFIDNRLVESTCIKRAIEAIYSPILLKGTSPFVYLRYVRYGSLGPHIDRRELCSAYTCLVDVNRYLSLIQHTTKLFLANHSP
ncbi:hypothetical protein M422DRAFT_49830 [Sphaerobolus stellatus SS14]|uniref:DNA mismatch repair protein S5 domain-containing protein n=1 Tax=Sphaerobolus stellatus (strain SS14) TaxID=990650 RepID=A0A0C9VBN2_SPHS4|nr:hypothetical protein M422DRAFT_49830 [Sphaerobolus stellatus SS14]